MRVRRPRSLALLVVGAALAGPAIRPVGAEYPGRNGRIAFVERLVGLRAVEPDGSDARPLTGKPIRHPAWSPDGRHIAYQLTDHEATRIYIVEADGGNEQHVVTGEDPSWSPDGKKLVFKGPDCTLWIRDLAAKTQTQITQLNAGVAVECHSEPAWQPNGDGIVFVRLRDQRTQEGIHVDLWLIGSEGSGATQLTDALPLGAADWHPTWSPDGKQIAFGRYRPYIGQVAVPPYGIYRIGAGGGAPTLLSYTAESPYAGWDLGYPAWAPDGKSIAFPYVLYPDTIFQIRVMDAAGGEGTPILSTANVLMDLDWQPLGELTAKPARIVIPDWRGESDHEFTRDPAVVTLYGTTVVPVHLRTGIAGEPVTLRAESQGAPAGAGAFGFSTDPKTVGPAQYATAVDGNGELDLYFVVRNLYAEAVEGDPVPTTLRLTATTGTGTPRQLELGVVDNRARIFTRYSVAQDYVPDGARSLWRNAFLPPLRGPIADLPGALLSAIVQPGNVAVGSVLCNTYQSRTLVFLNDLRHSDDGWLLNGLDYAPLQTAQTEHHFVGLYPSGEPWAFPRTSILDPWLPQTVAVYNWQEFVNFVDTVGQGSNIVPDARRDVKNPGTCAVQCGSGNYTTPPYPVFGGHYPYFPENAALPIARRYDGCLNIPTDWCARNGYGTPAAPRDAPPVSDHATVVIGSPVLFYVEMPDARGFGWELPSTFTNEFADEFTAAMLAYPEPDGSQGWYVEVPPGRAFELTTSALADGSMSVGILGAGGVVWGVYRNVAVRAGTSTRLAVNLDVACPALPLESGDDLACEQPQTACAQDAACRDADPCTDDGCREGLCTFPPRTGVAGARCMCEWPAPAQCAQQAVPPAVGRRTTAACALLAKAEAATGRKQRNRLTRAATQWRGAEKAAGSRKAKRVLSAGCVHALTTRLHDAMGRTKKVYQLLRSTDDGDLAHADRTPVAVEGRPGDEARAAARSRQGDRAAAARRIPPSP